jgi:long-chain acyl-CoA synthetase
MADNVAATAGLADRVRLAAAVHPDRTALIDASAGSAPARISWKQLDEAATTAGRALRASGLDDGARVTVQLPTGSTFVALYLGALRAGVVMVPVNPDYTVAELATILADAGAALLVTASRAAVTNHDLLRTAAPALRQLVAVAPAPTGGDIQSLPGWLGTGAGTADRDRDDRDPEQLAVLAYTSGTSGQPRGAMLSVRALSANLAQIASVTPPLVTADDIGLMPLPLFHLFGLNAGLGTLLDAGATAVLWDRFDARATLQLMADQGVTTVVGAPVMFAAWAAEPAFRDSFATVRFAMSGSAALPAPLAARYREAGCALYQGYGLTETGPVLSINALGGHRDDPTAGSVGSPLPGVDISVRDADGQEVDEGDPGQLFVRGDNLFSGYWPDGGGGPDADGWWGTGDVAIADQAGQLTIVGRTSDLVLVNGFNVYPAEVESVLARVPGVAEVAVIGVPDAVTGEAVVAYVVPGPGAELSGDVVIDEAARSLARFKLPRRVEVVASLPRTATGKVMKWQLPEGASHATG